MYILAVRYVTDTEIYIYIQRQFLLQLDILA